MGCTGSKPNLKQVEEDEDRTVEPRSGRVSRRQGQAGAKPDMDSKVPVKEPRNEKAIKKARKKIKEATTDNLVFKGLSDELMNEVCDNMFELPCAAGKELIRQGDAGDDFYVVISGEYQVYLSQVGDTPVKTFRVGGCFGELALMFNTPRAATIKCSAPGSVWVLPGTTFRQVVMANNMEAIDTRGAFLKSVDLLSSLNDEQREAIGEALETVKVKAGKPIVSQGSICDSLYFVQKGEVVVSEHTSQVADEGDDGVAGGGITGGKRLLDTGGFFGEECLRDVKASVEVTETVVAARQDGVPGVTLLRLRKEAFTQLVGDLQQALAINFTNKVLGGMKMFQALPQAERLLLIEALGEEVFESGVNIVNEGEEGERFYIIKQGQVQVLVAGPNADSPILISSSNGPGYYFGERALLNDEPRMATVKTTSDTVCLTLDRAQFKRILASAAHDLLALELLARDQEMARKARPPILLADLRLVRNLGAGQFGNVKLVVHTTSGAPYALKEMSKAVVIALKQAEHIESERQLLAHCFHPFLLPLEQTLQTDRKIYMVLGLARGGELFTRLHETDLGAFNSETAAFYAANVASVISYLHSKKIAYRDLKPENLVFGEDGYLNLVDFGFAKVVTDRTWTSCGTPEYIPPEIIQCKGHGLPVDWWTFGVLLYEMMILDTPFSAEDQMSAFSNIVNNKPSFPKELGTHATDLIQQCLMTNPSARIGCGPRGELDLQSHPFFKEVSFAALCAKKLVPPYIPKLPPLETELKQTHDGAAQQNDGSGFVNRDDMEAQYVTGSMDHLFANF